MKYSVGEIGRTIVARIEHGDDLLANIKELAQKEQIKSAVIFMLGALKSSKIVVGPKEMVIPPDGMPRYFDDGREILAIGTIFANEEDEPGLHIHGTMGREESVLTGCIRDFSEVYLVVELVIMELKGVQASRCYDPRLMINTLEIHND